MQARRALTMVMELGILRAGSKARSRITILDLKGNFLELSRVLVMY